VCVNMDNIKIVYGKAASNAVNENRGFVLQLYDYQLAVAWIRQSVLTFYHGDPGSNSSPCVAKH
jgi:hypothetical protein